MSDSFKSTTLPRVQGKVDLGRDNEDKLRPNINRYRPRKKQKFTLGTWVKVVEQNGKQQVKYIGTVEEYDPHTGLY